LSLDPVRRAIVDDAREEADRMLAELELELGGRIDGARDEAAKILVAARSAGEEEGRLEATRETSRLRTEARMTVLAAERELYDELCARSREATLALREDPGYRELLERLAAAARAALGPDAELEVDPPELGGVRARAGSRSVDYSLPTLSERCIGRLGRRLRRLWA
jgi:vacuolar-type H+-ATPase subunit E/Vma4